MRTTFNSTFLQSAVDLSRSTAELAKRQHQVSSGRRINSASDDPAAASGAVREHSEMAALDRYKQSADTATARLGVADSVLSSMVEELTAAKTTLLAARSSTVTPQQRATMALQLSGVRDALYSDLNTKFNGTFMFSGQAATVAPYQKVGGVVTPYAGTASEMMIDIDRETAVQVSFNADEIARGTDSSDIFVELANAIAAVQSGDTAGMDTAMAAVERAFTRTTAAQSGVGTGMQALEMQQDRTGDLRRASENRAAGFELVNLAEAITKMTQADTAYKAALGAIGTTGRISLMDYL